MSDQPVLFITELAALLRTSRRTLERRLKAGDDLPPQLPAIDKRPRWTRAAVDAWLARPAHVATFGRKRGGWR
jgi:predicted DNA-binding transcriptional regulator AlpA